MSRARLAGALLGFAVAVAGTPAALAQDSDTPTSVAELDVRSVDSRDLDAVSLVVGYTGAEGDLESAEVIENGEESSVASVSRLPDEDVALAIVLDTSSAMAAGNALGEAREALAEMLSGLPEGQRAAIVTTGSGAAHTAVRLTDDATAFGEALAEMAPTGASALWAGIDSAARILGEAESRQPVIIVVAAGPDQSSGATFTRARGSVTSLGAAVYVVGVEERGLDTGALRNLVGAAGGAYLPTTNPSAIPELVSDVAGGVTENYVLTYDSAVEGGAVDLTLRVGETSTDISFVAGGVSTGASALVPLAVEEPGGVGFLRENGLIIGAALVLLAAALAVYAIVSLVAPGETALESALDTYTVGGPAKRSDDDGGGVSLVRTAIVQQAVDLTEKLAKRQGFLASAEGALERANLPLRAGEALFFYTAGVFVLLVLAVVLTGNLLGGLVVAALGALLPPAIVNFLASRRQKKFMMLLPDMLQLLAGTLRAGYSLMQGVEAVSREVEEPMGKELRRIVTEARLGRPLEESMEASAARMKSDDFAWAVMAIGIQREVGGNLAELLMTVADTMTQRERLRRDVSTLTAEARVSAMVLGFLPIGLGAALYVMNPDYIGLLFEETMGQVMVGVATLMAAAGFIWMKKIVQVDV